MMTMVVSANRYSNISDTGIQDQLANSKLQLHNTVQTVEYCELSCKC